MLFLAKSLIMIAMLLAAVCIRGAINYMIDPTENSIKKAKFSFPDVVNLLRSFDIEIEDI